MDAGTDWEWWVIAFVAFALFLQFLFGGDLSDQPAVFGIGLLFLIPATLLSAIGGSAFWLFLPAAVFLVIVLFGWYKRTFGMAFYVVLYACMALLSAGL